MSDEKAGQDRRSGSGGIPMEKITKIFLVERRHSTDISVIWIPIRAFKSTQDATVYINTLANQCRIREIDAEGF